MCSWEEFIFICGCSVYRKQSRFHQARNDPYQECLPVKMLRDVWEQDCPCEKHTVQYYLATSQQEDDAHLDEANEADTQGKYMSWLTSSCSMINLSVVMIW
jgi:hypothetical protein